jgi:hypothetical protein
MFGMEGRRINRFLNIHAMMQHAQQHDGLPLILLFAAWRTEAHPGLAIAQYQRGGKRGARAFAGLQAIGQGFIQPEHLAARAKAEAKLRYGGRGLQPTGGGCGAYHIPGSVNHIHMAGITPRSAKARDRGLATAGRRGHFLCAADRGGVIRVRGAAIGEAWAEFHAGSSAD